MSAFVFYFHFIIISNFLSPTCACFFVIKIYRKLVLSSLIVINHDVEMLQFWFTSIIIIVVYLDLFSPTCAHFPAIEMFRMLILGLLARRRGYPLPTAFQLVYHIVFLFSPTCAHSLILISIHQYYYYFYYFPSAPRVYTFCD